MRPWTKGGYPLQFMLMSLWKQAGAGAVLAVAVTCGSSRRAAANRRRICRIPQQIAADRGAKDAQFASASDSPVRPEKRGQFLPLAYYAPDEGYRVPAMLAPFEGEEAIEMPTSTGKRREMRRAGQLKFSVKGQTLTLTAFVEATDRQMARLFVPFADQTNGSRDVSRGALSRSHAHRDRALRSRFQSRLPSVLLLQRRV